MTGTVKVYAAGLTTKLSPRIYAAGFTTVPSTSHPRVYAAGFTSLVSYPRIYAAGFTASGAAVIPVVDAIPAKTVDGFDVCTITPTSTPPASVWVYRVISGPVTLTGSGQSRTFTAPGTFDGTTVQIGVTAYNGPIASQERVATFTVKPWNSWNLSSGSIDPVDTLDGNGPVDILDGGTGSTRPTNTVDGGSGNGRVPGWYPRGPIHPIS